MVCVIPRVNINKVSANQIPWLAIKGKKIKYTGKNTANVEISTVFLISLDAVMPTNTPSQIKQKPLTNGATTNQGK